MIARNSVALFLILASGAALAQMQPPPGGMQGPPPGGMPGGPGRPGGPGGPGRPSGPQAGPLTVRPLGGGVYWAQGGVGNVGFVVGDTGVTVIDTTVSPDSARELLADIAKVTPKPVTAVILTHGDIDHIGGLAAFPAGIRIIAQETNARHMEEGIAAGRSRTPADHAPNHPVATHETMVLNGTRVELYHWAPAHTDGDLVIFLPAQKVVFTGDIFALDQPRALIHREQHGTSLGWIETARGLLKLDATQFVPGHGDVQTKAALTAKTDVVEKERDQITAMVAAGRPLPEIQAAVGDPVPGFARPANGPRFEEFSQVVYEELTGK